MGSARPDISGSCNFLHDIVAKYLNVQLFSLRSDPEPGVHQCQPCQCNGHGAPGANCGSHGQSCQCGNNTVSDMTPCNWLHLDRDCHSRQCSRCQEDFLGDPQDGFQCYRQMTVDSEYCFDRFMPVPERNLSNLMDPGEIVFFAIQPKFMNVDIRLFVDLHRGARMHVWISPDSQTFKVYPGTNNQFVVALGEDDDGKAQYFSREKRDLERLKRKRGLVAQLAANITPTTEDPRGSNKKTASSSSTFIVREKKISDEDAFAFLRVEDAQTIWSLPNVGHRLIISLPESVHDLRTNRFYLAIQNGDRQGSGGLPIPACYGSLYFRQDQLHIDLFIFFSVFFSCVFLFLSFVVLVWHVKSIFDRRRERRRVEMEMEDMAKRPYSKLKVVINDGEEGEWARNVTAAAHPHRKQAPGPSETTVAGSKRRNGGRIFRPANNIVSDSREVTLPLLDRREAFSGGVSHGNRVNPVVAVGPTSDGLAEVTTVLISLPRSSNGALGLSFGSALTSRNASKDSSK